jgi:hypothetical protein
MQKRRFAVFAQNYALSVSEFVRNSLARARAIGAIIVTKQTSINSAPPIITASCPAFSLLLPQSKP